MSDKNKNLKKEPWNKIENVLVDKNGDAVGFCKMPIDKAAKKMNDMFGKVKLADGNEVGAGDIMLHAYKNETSMGTKVPDNRCPICDAREPQRRAAISLLWVLLEKDPPITDLITGLRAILQFAEKKL